MEKVVIFAIKWYLKNQGGNKLTVVDINESN